MNPFMIQVQAEIKAQVNVIKNCSTDAGVFNELNITHHIVLKEKVETKVLNFEIKSWRSINRCDLRVLNIQFYLIEHHFFYSAIDFSPLRNILHCDVLKFSELPLTYHLNERVTRPLIKFFRDLLMFGVAVLGWWWRNGPIIWQQILHKLLIEYSTKHCVF